MGQQRDNGCAVSKVCEYVHANDDKHSFESNYHYVQLMTIGFFRPIAQIDYCVQIAL